MFRRLFAIVIATLSIALASTQLAEAHPLHVQCGPYEQVGACSPRFSQDQQVQIRSGVSFIWLRKTPSSLSGAVATVIYSPRATMKIVQWPSVWDGYQNWWLVSLLPNSQSSGWVEQASLIDLAVAPDFSDRATWATPFTGSIRPGIPFVWIRNTPDSSGSIIATLRVGNRFTVVGNPEPVYDGNQWWWYIKATTSSGSYEGYIEQASIAVIGPDGRQVAPAPAPSPVPTATQNPNDAFSAPPTVTFGCSQTTILVHGPRIASSSPPYMRSQIVNLESNTILAIQDVSLPDNPPYTITLNYPAQPAGSHLNVAMFLWNGTTNAGPAAIYSGECHSSTVPSPVPTATQNPNDAFNAPPTVTFGCSQITILVHGPKITASYPPFMRSQVVNIESNTVLAVQDVALPDNPPYTIILNYPAQPAGSRLNVAMFLWNGTSIVGSAAIYSGECH